MIKTLAIVAALSCGYAQADTIGVHLVSKHASETYERTYRSGKVEHIEYNNTNPGVYYIADNGATVGTYRNSYYRTTVYAGWTWQGPAYGPVSTAATVALATGYSNLRSVGVLRPIVVPSVTLAAPLDLSVKLSGLPVAKVGFLHLSIERKF